MRVVAITSCAIGVAHTYMAAEAIKKVCQKKGYACKIETQGALGIENILTIQEIKQSDMIILASDVPIANGNRLKPYQDKVKKVTAYEIVKNPNCIFD